jgi:hypothetical protein
MKLTRNELTAAARRAILPAALALSLAPMTATAALVTYGFDNITSTSATNVLTGETQLFMDVTDNGLLSNQVAFVFRNVGPNLSSITQIYFDDGTLLGISSIINGTGVDFENANGTGNLPGGNTIDFDDTGNLFSAEPLPPTQPNGVNPGEQVSIIFDLINGQSFTNVIAALDLGLANPGVDVVGGLRVGFHVQGFGDGGSESFVNGGCVENCGPDDPGSIPEPGTLALLGLGLMGLAARARKGRNER